MQLLFSDVIKWEKVQNTAKQEDGGHPDFKQSPVLQRKKRKISQKKEFSENKYNIEFYINGNRSYGFDFSATQFEAKSISLFPGENIIRILRLKHMSIIISSVLNTGHSWKQ